MSYPQLVIEYVFEGQQRGYNFTSPTQGYSDDVLKLIWRSAMPRGQGWGAYVDAESLKSFSLPDGRKVVSQVQVTDQQDESGRRGIRRAVIDVLAAGEYNQYLHRRFQALPTGIQGDADHQLENWRRTRVFERLTGKARKFKQVLFAHRYHTLADWRVLEAVLLKLALSPPSAIRALNLPLSFTTLALEHRDEMTLVAMPAEKIPDGIKAPVISVI